MTSLDLRFRPLATRQIDKFGKSAVYYRVTKAEYDPSLGESVEYEEPVTVKILLGEVNARDFSPGFVERGDKEITLAAENAIPPLIGDRIQVDQVKWNVINVNEVWSGEQVVLFILQVRK